MYIDYEHTALKNPQQYRTRTTDMVTITRAPECTYVLSGSQPRHKREPRGRAARRSRSLASRDVYRTRGAAAARLGFCV